jgi:hypothetical protein
MPTGKRAGRNDLARQALGTVRVDWNRRSHDVRARNLNCTERMPGPTVSTSSIIWPVRSVYDGDRVVVEGHPQKEPARPRHRRERLVQHPPDADALLLVVAVRARHGHVDGEVAALLEVRDRRLLEPGGDLLGRHAAGADVAAVGALVLRPHRGDRVGAAFLVHVGPVLDDARGTGSVGPRAHR